MKNSFTKKAIGIGLLATAVVGIALITSNSSLTASSHREAPLIANDPLADNTDLYAFRSPNDQNTITFIANYIPAELPQGGPNYYSFGEDVRYEIHVKNDPASSGDDIVYRFTFTQTNEDPTTFFNIRLGAENLKTTYNCERTIDGGTTWETIVTNGIVPPNNIGPRSIKSGVGLGEPSYLSIRNNAIATATTGETVFCGPSDDPFFVDLGGIFDLGGVRANNGPRDGLACKNVHSICIKVPIATLQKDGKSVSQATSILDSDFIIGVYATASRQMTTVRSLTGGKPVNSGQWVQISRIGMPLTNEVVIPIGEKDYWNSLTPYTEDTAHDKYFTNPELALYMDNSQFGGAVPGLSKLRIQRNSLQAFDFGNGKDGLAGLLGNPATTGTAFDQALFGNYLLRPGQPRSCDLLPIFLTGVPNLAPYQLATGKGGNPLAAGKPFINNFLPTFGDMLRLNMAVPSTPRYSPDFSSLGLIKAAVLGLTDPRFNGSTALQNIPNMDGFPNGRRLEDDVTRIELQAVSGVVLAAIGLWYDDYTAGSANPVTTNLLNVLNFTTGVEQNDKPFKNQFPYLSLPAQGTSECGGELVNHRNALFGADNASLKIGAPSVLMSQNYPNPAVTTTTFKYRTNADAVISIKIMTQEGKNIDTPLLNKAESIGTHELTYNVSKLKPGVYYAVLESNDEIRESIEFVVAH
jgi:Domain of unknown function (DUF4331)/Secretion system C-terminal sorting domain